MTIGGCFDCYTHRVAVLGWLKKEEEKKKRKNSDFRPFQDYHFKIVTTRCLLKQTGAGSISCSMYF